MSSAQSGWPNGTTVDTPKDLLHADHGPAIAGTAVAMIIITTIAIVMRFISRILLVQPKLRSRLWWDDYCALVSWVFSTSLCALDIYWVHLGLGKFIAGDDFARMRNMSKVSYASSFPYDMAMAFAKISAIFLYDRVFGHLIYFKTTLWLTGISIVAWLISFQVVNVVMCMPIYAYWTPHVQGGYCLSEKAVLLGNAIPNLATDLILLLIPLPALWALGIKKPKLISALSAFLLGLCVMLVSVLRVVTVARFIPANWFIPTDSYFYCQVLLMIQTPIALICICLPSMIPLFKAATSRRASNASSAFDPIAKYTYSLEPSISHQSAPEQSTRQIGVLGNLTSPGGEIAPWPLSSPSTGEESNVHSPRGIGHEISQHLSQLTHTFSWTNLQHHLSNDSQPPADQQPSLDNLFHPGGCGESYRAFTTNSRQRSSFSVPMQYKCKHSKKPNRLSEKVLHANRPQSHHEESVDPETGLRWDEEIKVSTTVDIEYERRRSSQMLQQTTTMGTLPTGSEISKEISPF